MINCFKSGCGRAEAALAGLTAAYLLAGIAAAHHAGRLADFRPLLYSPAVGLATLFLGLAAVNARVFYIMLVRRPARLGAYLARDFQLFFLHGGRLARALPVMGCFVIFISVFTSFKTLIPALHPFAWDVPLARLDRLLHGGTDPWRWLQPLLGHPHITSAINAVYNSWFFVMFGILYWQLFAVSRPKLRMRFFHTFFLTWMINGTVLALIFSSAGPCFYQAVTGDSAFEPLMSYLRAADRDGFVPALATQDMLWRGYRETGIGPGVGISAMPSVHVASAFLFMLLGWKTGRAAGWLLTAFFIMILAGSVHLAWHYAVDGYAAMAVTFLIWRGTGFIFQDRISDRSAPPPAMLP